MMTATRLQKVLGEAIDKIRALEGDTAARKREIDKLEVLLKAAKKDGFGFGDPQTIQWSREKDGNQIMRRSSIKGLAGAVYDNMDWTRDYKYKVFGTLLETTEGPALIFRLDDPIINVRIKPEQCLLMRNPGSLICWL